MTLNNNQSISTGRFAGFDILKAVSAFLVVIIHSHLPQEIYCIIEPITRIAVPIFFMISGYFYIDTWNKSRTSQQIQKLFKLFVSSNLLYACWSLLWSYVYDAIYISNGLKEYIQSLLNVSTWIKFIFLNNSPFGIHLWYIGALLYVLIIAFFIKKFNADKLMYIVVPLLIIFNVLAGKYSVSLFQTDFGRTGTCNFLFMGLPLFYCGVFIRKLKEKNQLPSYKTTVVCSMILILLSVVENLIGTKFLSFAHSDGDLYLTTVPLAFFIICYFIRAYENKALNRIEKIISNIGREYSLSIYICHIIILGITLELFRSIGLENVYAYISPLFGFINTVGVVFICKKIKNFLPQNRHKT